MGVLRDGHPTKITMGTPASAKFYFKTVTPPGWSGGGGNSSTHMGNVRYRTQKPKKLLTINDIEGTCSYEVVALDTIDDALQLNQLFTVEFEDGDKIKVWGWLEEFVPQENKEGDQPTAKVKIMISNENASGVETGPVYEAHA